MTPLNLSAGEYFSLQESDGVYLLRLDSADGTNCLTCECVRALREIVNRLAKSGTRGLAITGNHQFFSAGADLAEVAALTGPQAYEFARMGQDLMCAIDEFPARVAAAVRGYCMGGGLDLALACDYRIAHPHAIFGHRGAALGLITGWGGTQRLPRLIGEAHAVQMFVAAEKLTARRAWEVRLVQELADDPVRRALEWLSAKPCAPTDRD